MSAVEVFQFPATGQRIRTVVVDGEPWFVAADVCRALDLDVSAAMRRLDDDEYQQVEATLISSQGPARNVVSESGLFSLILGSRKAEAKAFKRWVTHEVLPAIRKTGKYEIASPPAPAYRLPATFAGALRELASTVEELDEARQELQVVKPAAEAWKVLASAVGDYSVADAAKVLSRDPMIKVGSVRLFRLLDEWGWIYRQPVDQRWRVYQTAVETGRMSEIPQSHYHPRSGELVLDPPQVRVSVKGIHDIRCRILSAAQTKALSSAELSA